VGFADDEAVARDELVDDRPARDDWACELSRVDESVDEPPGLDAVLVETRPSDVLAALTVPCVTTVWPDDEADSSEVAGLLALEPPRADGCVVPRLDAPRPARSTVEASEPVVLDVDVVRPPHEAPTSAAKTTSAKALSAVTRRPMPPPAVTIATSGA
jgi:hypothetical protein